MKINLGAPTDTGTDADADKKCIYKDPQFTMTQRPLHHDFARSTQARRVASIRFSHTIPIAYPYSAKIWGNN